MYRKYAQQFAAREDGGALQLAPRGAAHDLVVGQRLPEAELLPLDGSRLVHCEVQHKHAGFFPLRLQLR